LRLQTNLHRRLAGLRAVHRAPKVDYTIGENSAKMPEHGIARAKEVMAAAGATDICVNCPILYGVIRSSRATGRCSIR
jgi:hypothetical protein